MIRHPNLDSLVSAQALDVVYSGQPAPAASLSAGIVAGQHAVAPQPPPAHGAFLSTALLAVASIMALAELARGLPAIG
ncbi:MAG: hypothetical protein OSA97_13525, partial [Nevskia sp.]|nr:hypothetical protein [Nevskia sp.]